MSTQKNCAYVHWKDNEVDRKQVSADLISGTWLKMNTLYYSIMQDKMRKTKGGELAFLFLKNSNIAYTFVKYTDTTLVFINKVSWVWLNHFVILFFVHHCILNNAPQVPCSVLMRQQIWKMFRIPTTEANLADREAILLSAIHSSW